MATVNAVKIADRQGKALRTRRFCSIVWLKAAMKSKHAH